MTERERLIELIQKLDIMSIPKSRFNIDPLAEIKAEAIKEFAERLKEKTYPFPCAIGIENAVTIRAIDDLLKEMVGKSK